MDFNTTAVNALADAIISMCKQLGVFSTVLFHEPRNPPSSMPAAAIWWRDLIPAQSSGLASVSGTVTFTIRIFQSAMGTIPQNKIDPALMKNAALILQALSGGFTLGGTVREVDLLGAEGTALSVKSGYLPHGDVLLRVADITVPVVINDLWQEAA
jgi:hypothetical protein